MWGLRERGKARRGWCLRPEEDVVRRSRTSLQEVLPGLTLPETRVELRGGASSWGHGAVAAGFRRLGAREALAGQELLLLPLLVLHLLQLLGGLHLGELLALLTHLLREKNRRDRRGDRRTQSDRREDDRWSSNTSTWRLTLADPLFRNTATTCGRCQVL